MTVILYLCAALSFAFSLACFLPSFSLQSMAFPLAAIASGVTLALVILLLRKPDRARLARLRKFLEYLPFILFAAFVIRRSGDGDCPFSLDLASVALWLAASALTVFALYRLSDKRVERFFPNLGGACSRKKPLALQALEWVDALVQAACLVLLINLFVFQLYAIPSESMVPEFMIGDRVFVPKILTGPKFPLSDVGIPRLRGFKRGDIVVFSNPHYNDTKDARVRSFASQLVYMLSFTTVNINRDEFGAIKADPLVKRITGEPGEKIMLVDGVLYAKRAGDAQFRAVEEDATWAAWNVAALPRSELALVKSIPLDADKFTLLESVESTRANLDLAEAATEARALADRFMALKPARDTVAVSDDLIPHNRMEVESFFSADSDVARILLTTNGGVAWFNRFMAGWASDTARANLYDETSLRLDVLLKLDYGRLIVRDAELMVGNATLEAFNADPARLAILSDAEKYLFYLRYNDWRNMGEFPAGTDEYIPANNYFMMGDNRFNSLDMRHSYDPHLASVDASDPYSFVYRSQLSPQYVPVSKILGSARFRFWPLSRAGIPK